MFFFFAVEGGWVTRKPPLNGDGLNLVNFLKGGISVQLRI